jgi:hypothetical protein
MKHIPCLPLLDAFEARVSSQRGILTGWRCVYVQHLLASNMSCLAFLKAMGLDPRDVRIFGKGYSTSEAVLSELNSLGWNVWEPKEYRYNQAFDELIIEEIGAFLVSQRSETRPLLIIDEGGLATRAIAKAGYSCDRLTVVELTSRGAEHYALVAARAPVVDVARSFIKKGIESRYIASSMIENLLALDQYQTILGDGRQIGLIGGGAIGSAIVAELRDRCIAFGIYDQDAARGSVGTFGDLLQQSTTIMSSTGDGPDWTVPLAMSVGPKVLVNCGSSDVEYSPWKLREYVERHGGTFVVEHPHQPWIGRVVVEHRQSRFVLLRGGFPINFDGSPDPIPPHVVQLTRTALMAGAIQAAASDRPGVVDLDGADQLWIAETYRDLVKAR